MRKRWVLIGAGLIAALGLVAKARQGGGEHDGGSEAAPPGHEA